MVVKNRIWKKCSSLRNRRHPPPPPPVGEAPSRSQVDEPSTRRRLRFVPPPPLRPLSRWLNAFCWIASTYFWQSFNGKKTYFFIRMKSSKWFQSFGFGLLTSWSELCCICCRNLQLHHNSIMYYNTVAEMHIFLSEVDFKAIGKSITCRLLKSVSRLTSDNDVVD